jgi:uncharacterized protein
LRALAITGRQPLSTSAPQTLFFRSAVGQHVLVVPHSRIYDVPADADEQEVTQALDQLGAFADGAGEVPLAAVVAPAPQALSLNVSSTCNLSCSYCYAGRGAFAGAQAASMDFDTAQRAVDRLLAVADPSRPITVGFLGGEPFTRRLLLREVVEYAEREGSRLGLDVRFAVTTNGTLLDAADLDLLRQRRFSVTVSMDGHAAAHDAQRPRSLLRGSFDEIVRRVRPLLEHPGRAQVAARATVLRSCVDLPERFEALVGLGFAEVGFSALRQVPGGTSHAIEGADWGSYLEQLLRVAGAEVERARGGATLRLSNLAVALKQLARGVASPYPCGAGGGYFSVSAEGRWYACHRAIGDAAFELGDSEGLDTVRRERFLVARHVHNQAPCQGCFARYLCSGGCHHEAASRSESSCDFVRGWLLFCLATYCELGSEHLQTEETKWPAVHPSS